MITALKYDNLIYTNLVNYVSDVCKNVTRYPNDSPAEFPAVGVTLMDAPAYGSVLEPGDTGSTVTYEIQCFSIQGERSMTAKKLMSLCVEAFEKMGFRLDYLGQVDTTIKYVAKAGAKSRGVLRIVARVSRYIGSGDVITKF